MLNIVPYVIYFLALRKEVTTICWKYLLEKQKVVFVLIISLSYFSVFEFYFFVKHKLSVYVDRDKTYKRNLDSLFLGKCEV